VPLSEPREPGPDGKGGLYYRCRFGYSQTDASGMVREEQWARAARRQGTSGRAVEVQRVPRGALGGAGGGLAGREVHRVVHERRHYVYEYAELRGFIHGHVNILRDQRVRQVSATVTAMGFPQVFATFTANEIPPGHSPQGAPTAAAC